MLVPSIKRILNKRFLSFIIGTNVIKWKSFICNYVNKQYILKVFFFPISERCHRERTYGVSSPQIKTREIWNMAVRKHSHYGVIAATADMFSNRNPLQYGISATNAKAYIFQMIKALYNRSFQMAVVTFTGEWRREK